MAQDKSPATYGIPGINYSGFEKGWLITDLVFCSLRVILVIMGLIGFAAMKIEDPLYRTSIF